MADSAIPPYSVSPAFARVRKWYRPEYCKLRAIRRPCTRGLCESALILTSCSSLNASGSYGPLALTEIRLGTQLAFSYALLQQQ